jgi:hypothetical protein
MKLTLAQKKEINENDCRNISLFPTQTRENSHKLYKFCSWAHEKKNKEKPF